MNAVLYKLVKELQYLSPLRRYFFPRFPFYNMPAPHLCYLCQCLETVRDIPGVIVEVGCAQGATTLFLNKYMDWQQIERDYYCIDTFSGFTAADVLYEKTFRGKNPTLYMGFRANRRKWFDYTMRINQIRRVHSIKADANHFDFSTLGAISFCLLDVDLYRPIKHSLPAIFRALSPGGLLLVHDCNPANPRWDGADQAYREFVRDIGHAENIVHEIGLIKKGPSNDPSS